MFGEPETAAVSRTDGVALDDHVPSYMTRPASFSAGLRESLRLPPVVKIIDFGESFLKGKAANKLHTPLAVRAPEVVFGGQIDYRVDLWSMGCLV